MTREEQIYNAMGDAESKHVDGTKDIELFDMGFKEGAEWADSHPRWISVEDELPKKNIQVLCHGYDRRCKLGKGYMFTSCRVDKANYYRRDGNGFIVTGVPSAFSRVTHWMPLPQAPKS